MLCPICAEEFETNAGRCLSCGCELVASTLNDEAGSVVGTSEERDVEFVELCRPQSHPEAMFIKQTLEQNHVAVLIQGMHSLSVMPYLAFGGQLRLMVGRNQLAYAQALYKAYFESDEGTVYAEEE
ncbi:MAG: hypothetical protein AABO57_00380 [Acidobacteriota bacterium]